LVFSFVISSLRFLELGLCIQNLEYLVFGFWNLVFPFNFFFGLWFFHSQFFISDFFIIIYIKVTIKLI
jgi:hypothetical protein